MKEPIPPDQELIESSDSEDFANEIMEEGPENYKPGGYHPVHLGQIYNSKYVIIKKLGWGHFSTVWLGHDKLLNQTYAIKVQKSSPSYSLAAEDENRLFESIDAVIRKNGLDKSKIPVVHLVESFFCFGPNGKHTCFVFPMLGDNLLKLIKHYKCRGVPLSIVKKLTVDILKGLDFLHSKCQIIHTDLKPENVLLSSPLPEFPKFIRPKVDWDLVYRLLGYQDDDDEVVAILSELKRIPPATDEHVAQVKNLKAICKKKGILRPHCPQTVLSNYCSTYSAPIPPSVEVVFTPSNQFSYPDNHLYAKFHIYAPAQLFEPLLFQTARLQWIFVINQPLPTICKILYASAALSSCVARVEKETNTPESNFAKHFLLDRNLLYSLYSIRMDVRSVPFFHFEHKLPGLYFLHLPSEDQCSHRTEHFLVKAVLKMTYKPQTMAFSRFDGFIIGLYIPPQNKTCFIKPFSERFCGFPGPDFCTAATEPVKPFFSPDQEIHCSIVDLGNGCWTYKHLASEIQTRQYRSPEVMIGAKYATSADIWSCACMVYELITGCLLFTPKKGTDDQRNTDHLSMCMNLLGKYPVKFILSGKYSKNIFTTTGDFKQKVVYKPMGLAERIQKEISLTSDEAMAIQNFLLPMLTWEPEKRATAKSCLSHPWLRDI